jgi:hypothetical protein
MIKRIIMLVPIILLLIIHLSLFSIFYTNQRALAAQDSASRFPFNILIDSLNNIVMTNPKETSFSVYENPIYGIKILYPASWDKLEFGLNPDGLIVGFALPREGKSPSEINVSDFVLENIVVRVKSIPSSPSLSSKGTILNDFVNEQISSYKQEFAGFQIIKSNTNAINNNPTYQIQYTHKDGRATFDTLQIWTINGNKIYTILFNADPVDYPTYLPVIQKMTDSFAIFNNNNNPVNNNQMKLGNV